MSLWPLISAHLANRLQLQNFAHSLIRFAGNLESMEPGLRWNSDIGGFVYGNKSLNVFSSKVAEDCVWHSDGNETGENFLSCFEMRLWNRSNSRYCDLNVCVAYVWRHKICSQAKFKNGCSYQHNFFFNRWVWMRGTQRVKKTLKKVWKKGVKSWKKVWNC